MPEPTSAPKPRKSLAVRLGAVAAGLTAVAAISLVAVRANAHKDWPGPTQAVAIPPASVTADASLWPLYAQAIEAMPRDPAVRALATGPRDANDVSPESLAPFAESVRRFDLALAQRGTPVVPALDRSAGRRSPFLDLITLARVRALSARRDASGGQRAQAVSAANALIALGSKLGQASNDWLAFAASVAIEQQGHRVLAKALDAESLSEDALRSAASTIDEALAAPSPIARAFASECAQSEVHFASMRGQPASALMATSTIDDPNNVRPGWSALPASWLFDVDATINAHRQNCQRTYAALNAQRGHRQLPSTVSYISRDGISLGQWLDNRFGRVLLSIESPGIESYVRRDDDAHAARITARTAVAIAQFRLAQQRLPSALTELTLAAPREPLVSPRALQWNASERTLSLAAPEPERAPIVWQFAP